MSLFKQTERIIQYMHEFGSITQAEATEHIGCMRLAARIADIRANGIAVRKVMERSTNRYGDIVCYARYYPDRTEGENNGDAV